MSLNKNASVFIPKIESFDSLFRKVLRNHSDYYIKGGQAFNYYSKIHVDTFDYDLVATEPTVLSIFEQVTTLCKNKILFLPNGTTEFITTIQLSPCVVYKDKIKGKKQKQMVRSITLNHHTLIDFIMMSEIKSIVSEDQLCYMELFEFIKDIECTLRDRTKKYRYCPTEEMRIKKEKTYQRYLLLQK